MRGRGEGGSVVSAENRIVINSGRSKSSGLLSPGHGNVRSCLLCVLTAPFPSGPALVRPPVASATKPSPCKVASEKHQVV